MKYISIRVVDADDYDEARTKVQVGHFEDRHTVSDIIIPLTDELDANIAKAIYHQQK